MSISKKANYSVQADFIFHSNYVINTCMCLETNLAPHVYTLVLFVII